MIFTYSTFGTEEINVVRQWKNCFDSYNESISLHYNGFIYVYAIALFASLQFKMVGNTHRYLVTICTGVGRVTTIYHCS